MKEKNSRLQGFYQLSPLDRLQAVGAFDGLNTDDLRALHGANALSVERADKMIENVVGTFSLPLGIATNFRINGKDKLIPMAVEEPSIVAGARSIMRSVSSRGPSSGSRGRRTRPRTPRRRGRPRARA